MGVRSFSWECLWIKVAFRGDSRDFSKSERPEQESNFFRETGNLAG